MNNFWKEFNKPIIGMAPMDGITDAAFRFMVAKYGRPARLNFAPQNLGGPDVMYTEFVPVDGICAMPTGRQAGADKVMDGFIFDENERPIIAQIFGGTPGNFYKVAPILCELGFDGIDINMGCPDRAIVKQGGGASLIGNPEKAKEIVAAVKGGINDWVGGKKLEEFGLAENIVKLVKNRARLPDGQAFRRGETREAIPVSVKTRIGTDKNIMSEWARYLVEMELACVCIHGRTLKQGYEGVADWEAIAEGAEVIKKSGVIVLGNGDVKDLQTAKDKIEKYGVDGVLIGRAVMGAPWFFGDAKPNIEERLQIAIEHARYYEQIFPDRLFVNMRKHLAWYCGGFHGASDARAKLMKTNSAKECNDVILDILKNLDNY